MIRCYIEGKVRNWDVDFPLLVMALHVIENRSTGYTPYRLMLGREVVLPVDIVTGMASLTLTDYEPDKWVKHLDNVMAEAHSFARKQLFNVYKGDNKRLYDMKLNEKAYSEGDLVYRLNEATTVGQSRKLQSPWKGPYLVISCDPPLYTIMDQKERQFTLRHDKLKMCNDREMPLWIRCLRNTFFSGDESLSKRTCDDHTIAIAKEDPVDSNKLGGSGRDFEKSDDTTVIHDTVASNVGDTCNQESTFTTRAGRKIIKPAHLKDYF